MYGNNHWKLAEAHMKLAEDYQELKGKYGRNYWKFSVKDQIMSYRVTTMCMKADNPGLKSIKGDNIREIIICEQQGFH